MEQVTETCFCLSVDNWYTDCERPTYRAFSPGALLIAAADSIKQASTVSGCGEGQIGAAGYQVSRVRRVQKNLTSKNVHQ
jgi:hypothetical protein